MYTNDELLKRRAGLSMEKMALLQQRIRHTSVPERDAMTIPQRPAGTTAPLSFAQQRLWFLQQLDPENTAYNEVIALHLHGALNYEALTRAIGTLVQRHEILRSVFPIVGDEVCQVISPVEQKDVEVPLVDLRPVAGERMHEARRWIDVEVQRPFHLMEELPWRICLLRLDEEEHIFLTNMHHIIIDAWSLDLFVRELMALYRTSCAGLPSSLPDLPVQYADYAYWQRQWLAGAVLDRQVAYWQQQLSGTLPVLHLPTDRPRPPVWTHQGQRCSWEMPATLYEALCQLSRREGVTLFMVLLAAFNVLLYRYTMQDDILVGTPVAGRTRPELETLLGCFVNTLVLRTDLSGNPTFCELLQRVRAMALGAYDHQDVPFEKLVEVLKPERDMGRNPLFQVMFVLQNISLATNGLSELTVTPVDLDSKTSRLDVSLVLQETAHRLHGYVEYNTDLFDATTIERMLGHYQKILENVVAHPAGHIADLALLQTAEEQQIVVEWNTTHVPYPETLCLQQVFEAQVERTPDATAIVFENECLSYRELNERANQLAHFLRANGVGMDVPVGVYMERSPAMMVSLLAILKAGGAYVPLDPTYPADRLAFMLEDSKAPIVLAQAKQLSVWTPTLGQVICVDTHWAQIAGEAPHCFAHNPTSVSCDHLAYIIYTSGSTGRPKGVMVTHRNLLHSTSARVSYYRQPVGRFLLLSSFAFDSANVGIFWTLCHGGTLILLAEDKQKDLSCLLHTVEQEQVSHLLTVPSLYKVLLAQPAAQSLDTLRVAIVGGEICSKELVEQHYRLLSHTALFNEYGPTEGTVWCSVYACQPHEPRTSVPIGRPIANTQLYILDQHGQPVPVGVAGELHIGGIGVARGYLNRPALTAERFVPHYFSAEQGARLYKTGDLARYLPDGTIEFLGRSDTQVKVRGFRIELAEIEAVLSQHPAISACVVLAREDTPGDTRVVAYMMRTPEQYAPLEELRRFLNERLPVFMLPSIYMYVDQLPLLPNGKIDRRALPTPDTSRPSLEVDFTAARDPVEEIVAGIWSRVLGIEQIGLHDDFFALGGHSLLQAQVAASVRAAFSIDLPLLSFFLSPTVAALAKAIKQHLQEDLGAVMPVMSVMSVMPVMPSLLPVSREGELPLSFTQQRQWLLDQLDPQSHLSNIFGAVRLHGPLQIMALEQSLQEVVRRHEMLRTTFAMRDDGLVQLVSPSCLLPLAVVDLQELPQNEQEYAIMRLINREKQWSFDLSHGPLLRASVLQLAEEEHILLLTSHHIIFDGWSIELLQRELATLYTAFVQDAPSPLADLPVQYADYACWQREVLQGKTLAGLLGYWKQKLVDLPVLTLPADHPRLAARTFRAEVVAVHLPRQLAAALSALNRCEGVTMFMTLLAAFQAVLARYSGQSDIVVGSPIANRNRAELEGLIGCFINTLVLRTDVGGNPTFRELLRRVRETALGAYAHQELPFEKLLEELQPERDPGRNPLFQVLFAFQNIPQQQISIPGLTTSFLSVESETTIYDLDLTMWEYEDELVGSFKYNADLFDPPLIKRIKDDFVALLELVVTDPDLHITEIPLLSTAEQQQLLVEWNATAASYDREACIQQLFEAQAERTPHAVAVVCGEESLTYWQLNQQANQLAHHLRSLGVAPGSMVAIFMERSLEMIPALIAVLKAGASYVPLEVRFPRSRIAWILSSLEVQVMITQSTQLPLLEQLKPVPALKHAICVDVSAAVAAHDQELQQRVWTRSHLDQLSGENLPALATSNAIAYVIFTSGSTGTPKGVMVRHQPVINLINWVNQTFAINAADRMLFVTSLCFDLSVYDIFGMLATGGSIQVARDLDLQEPERLLDMLYREPITFWDSAPAALQQLVPFFPVPGMNDERSRQSCWRLVFLSGDWIPVKLPDQVHSAFPGAEVVSLGGATEATVWSNFYRIGAVAPEWVSIPYGKPIQNAQYYILDTYLQPCPTGVPGDLYISGECLATGYVGEPELTAQKFIPSPFSDEPGMRLYRTGDLARFWADGTMEFLGRSDAQVKIRGFRVELGEIEVALTRHPAVQVAIVEARRDAAGEKRLVAYVVAEAGQALSARELRVYLQESLPDYMLPTAFVLLDTLPLTSNGKVDRRKLPSADEFMGVEQAESYIAPTTPIEETMASIWSDVLKLPRVGIHDNFFEIGGHSLLAVQLIARVRAAWQIHLPLRDLFAFSTVAMLAARVEEVLMAPPAQVAQDASAGVWYDDAVLDPAIRPEGTYSAVTAEPATMFLTNSTGFLGTFLLAELLHKTSATMYCLVRCHNNDDGMNRIKAALEGAYLWQPEFADRIIPVRGDLAQPLLGVSAPVFEQLATTVDVIYHNASLVSSVLPYEELKATNVLGTVDVLRLATQRKVKPLHYISTLSVFSPAGVTPGHPVLEEDALDAHRDYLLEGYEQSKWVAETLVAVARERGLPVAIYRPGRMTGHSRTGVWQTDDLLCRQIKGCIQLGSIPTIIASDVLEMIPVDYISQSIVALSTQASSSGQVFHLWNATCTSVSEIVAWINDFGYPVQQVPYDIWHTALQRTMEQISANTLAPFLTIYPEQVQEHMSQESTARVIFDDRNTRAALAATSIVCPPVDARLLHSYLSYLVRCGFLPAPHTHRHFDHA